MVIVNMDRRLAPSQVVFKRLKGIFSVNPDQLLKLRLHCCLSPLKVREVKSREGTSPNLHNQAKVRIQAHRVVFQNASLKSGSHDGGYNSMTWEGGDDIEAEI